MSFKEKVDALDLIITALKDHEKRLDGIAERLAENENRLARLRTAYEAWGESNADDNLYDAFMDVCEEVFGSVTTLERYKRGYHILMEYFDSISDEERPKVDAQLKSLGL